MTSSHSRELTRFRLSSRDKELIEFSRQLHLSSISSHKTPSPTFTPFARFFNNADG